MAGAATILGDFALRFAIYSTLPRGGRRRRQRRRRWRLDAAHERVDANALAVDTVGRPVAPDVLAACRAAGVFSVSLVARALVSEVCESRFERDEAEKMGNCGSASGAARRTGRPAGSAQLIGCLASSPLAERRRRNSLGWARLEQSGAQAADAAGAGAAVAPSCMHI